MPLENILILGAKGTLGTELAKLYPRATAWDREDIDVLDYPALRAKIAAQPTPPEAIINCVAFNDVDGAEDRPQPAFALNGEYVGELARITAALSIPLVHYSTNYVFDGIAGEYAEDATPSPLSVYGRSKRRGEELALANAARVYVVRTAVIFGLKGESDLSKKSFVDIMLDLSTKRDVIQAVADEVNSVTYAPDLAAATRGLLDELPLPGIYHATNSGSASWCDFAKEIFRITGKPTQVHPVPSTHFPRKAARPPRAVLLTTKRSPLRSWQSALAEFLSR